MNTTIKKTLLAASAIILVAASLSSCKKDKTTSDDTMKAIAEQYVNHTVAPTYTNPPPRPSSWSSTSRLSVPILLRPTSTRLATPSSTLVPGGRKARLSSSVLPATTASTRTSTPGLSMSMLSTS